MVVAVGTDGRKLGTQLLVIKKQTEVMQNDVGKSKVLKLHRIPIWDFHLLLCITDLVAIALNAKN